MGSNFSKHKQSNIGLWEQEITIANASGRKYIAIKMLTDVEAKILQDNGYKIEYVGGAISLEKYDGKNYLIKW